MTDTHAFIVVCCVCVCMYVLVYVYIVMILHKTAHALSSIGSAKRHLFQNLSIFYFGVYFSLRIVASSLSMLSHFLYSVDVTIA